MTLQDDLRTTADEVDFSGIVLVVRGGERVATVERGEANRAEGAANHLGTRFATASVTKGFTALAVASLIEEGRFDWTTSIREFLGEDLPPFGQAVTVQHLLGHTSGIGDYLDEESSRDIDEHVLGVGPHTLEGPEDYLVILDSLPQVEPPGSRFRYNNAGFVTLALLAERASGCPFHRLVAERVFEPATMTNTGFFRSDELPALTAIGYLKNGRSNVFHLPVVGGGDGGAYTTAADLASFWRALFDNRIVGSDTVEALVSPRPTDSTESYGLGFWIRPDGEAVNLEGMDAGVSARTGHHRPSGLTWAVLSNTSPGAWPLAKIIERHVPGPGVARGSEPRAQGLG